MQACEPHQKINIVCFLLTTGLQLSSLRQQTLVKHHACIRHCRLAVCRVLDLEECRGIGADSLGYALTGLPRLRVLSLSGNPEVSDALLSEAALAAPLREVSLSR